MALDSSEPLHFITGDLPGIGGDIKTVPEDFEVEELPAYQPSGQGEFLYLWVEKRDMGAEYFMRQVAKRLNVGIGEVGSAGLKDRHAVTRQMLSAPIRAETNLNQLTGDGITLLTVNRHVNKLRPGHLRGNRFKVVLRNVLIDESGEKLTCLVERIKRIGLPNFFGEQRFGKGGETLSLGRALLRGEDGAPRNRPSPFLRKLALSAVQSALFNRYLAQRIADGLLRQVLPGDVMAKWPFGGLFVAENVACEQERFDARETVTAGPIFGKKTFPAKDEAAAREQSVLTAAGLNADLFRRFGKLLSGTRRHNLIYVDDLSTVAHPHGVQLTFSLPAGSYATVLLREFTRSAGAEEIEGS